MKVPLTVADYIDRAAFVYPDRVAVVDEPGTPGSLGTLTYGQLAARARGMVRALDQLGVEQGEREAIVRPNAARFVISFYGVSGYGRVLVPVNFRLTADEVSYIVDHSGAKVLLVDPELEESLATVPVKERVVLDGKADAQLFGPAADGAFPSPWTPDEDA